MSFESRVVNQGSHMEMDCKYELHELPETDNSAIKDHGKTLTEVRPPLYLIFCTDATDDYAKDGVPRAVWLLCSCESTFTKFWRSKVDDFHSMLLNLAF